MSSLVSYNRLGREMVYGSEGDADPGRGADKNWALEVSHIPKNNQEEDQRRLLVLQWRCRHDQVTRLTALPKCENERGRDGNVGRKGPRRIACPPGQPQVAEKIARVSGALRGRKNCGQLARRGGGLGTKNGRMDCLGGPEGWGPGPVNMNVLTDSLAFLIGGLIPQAMRTAHG
jgi:hypothetical protein